MRESMRDIMSGVAHDATPRPKRIANNTVEYWRDGERVIRLHRTDILRFGNRTIWLNSGGWQTVTTKDRLNASLSAHSFGVYSDRGKWIVSQHGNGSVPFYDGLTIRDGKLPPPAVKPAAKQDKLAKDIKRFVDKLDKLTELPQPAPGDCWACSMFDRATFTAPGPVGLGGSGSKSRDPSHLAEHIKEGYLHGSLLVNAMRWAGWTDFRMQYAYSEFTKDGRYRSDVKRVLRRFLKAQLGLPV